MPTAANPVAIVTGAASGLGASVAEALRLAGWTVAGFDLRASDTALGLLVDVTDPAAVVDAANRVSRELGPIEALVTVAGIYEELPIVSITDERWDRMLAVNIGGTVTVCSAVVPLMLERGRGAIVTISSDLGLGGS